MSTIQLSDNVKLQIIDALTFNTTQKYTMIYFQIYRINYN